MRPRRPAHNLRTSIDCLPLSTRRAMLSGVEANTIIVGAYSDGHGGICPMLAAHRNGGRTSLASFARAWDRYTGARGKPRPASARELNTLRAMLEASVMVEEIGALPRPQRPRRLRRPTGETSRAAELRGRAGWAWLRPFRRLDEYERALAELDSAAAARRERDLEGV